MTRTRRVWFTLSVAATAAVGCKRPSPYPEPPAGSYSIARFGLAPEAADTVTGAMVSPEFFPATRVRPVLGRLFLPGEHESTAIPVVVISDKLWRQRFKAAPNLLGTRIPVNGKLVVLIGVVPPDFAWPTGAMLWLPSIAR